MDPIKMKVSKFVISFCRVHFQMQNPEFFKVVEVVEFDISNISHRIHVWHIYLHLPWITKKINHSCRKIFHFSMDLMGFQGPKMEESSPTLRLHLSAHQDMVSYKEFITWALERWWLVVEEVAWFRCLLLGGGHHAAGGSLLKLHPRKQTWNLHMGPSKRIFLVETTIFRFYVKNFQGSIL